MANNKSKPAVKATPGKSIADRIHQQRGELFIAMAVVAVTRDSIDMEDNCDRHIALRHAYKQLDRIAMELCMIAEGAEGGAR